MCNFVRHMFTSYKISYMVIEQQIIIECESPGDENAHKFSRYVFGDVLRFAGARQCIGHNGRSLILFAGEHIYFDFLFRHRSSWSRGTYVRSSWTRLEFNIPISRYRLLHTYKTSNRYLLGLCVSHLLMF